MSFHRPPDTAASPPWHPPPRRAGRDFTSAAGATAVVLLALATACTSVRPPQPQPVESGIASWYGGEFHGRMTASGEPFDTHQLTAAHRTLPFGTVVEVHDLDNDRRVRVRINDRGPFVRHRVIDLSYAAARELDMVGPGTAHVELTVVATGPAPLPGGSHYTVQIAAFADPERAEALYGHLLPSYPEATVRSDGTWHRVQVGEFDQRRSAERLRRELARLGYAALVVTFR
jgi:peptidoglycan lytic transglycosylase